MSRKKWSITRIKRMAGSYWLEAMTTQGYVQQHPRCKGGREFRNLAWIGDAFLHLIVTEYLVQKNGFGSGDEEAMKQLNHRRIRLESSKALKRVAEYLDLEPHFRSGGEILGPRRYSERVEALIAGIYSHSGEEAARTFILDCIIHPLTDGVSDEAESSHDEICREFTWSRAHCIMPMLQGTIRKKSVAIEHGKDGKSRETRLTRLYDLFVANDIIEDAQKIA